MCPKRRRSAVIEGICSEDDCDNPISAKGLCRKHYGAAHYAKNREARKAAQREYYEANKPALLAQKAEYYVRKIDEIKPKRAAWRAENRDYINETSAIYRKRDREKLRLRQIEWRLANPNYMADWQRENAAKLSESNYRRRVRLAEARAGANISQRDWDRLIRRFDNRCAYCECSLDGCFTIDHVVPISKGGRHTIGNLVPACRSCNSSKRDLLLFDWLQRRATRSAVAA